MTKDNPYDWDADEANNEDIAGVPLDGNVATPADIDNAVRELMAQIAAKLSTDSIASATTTDLSTVDAECVTITGTTTITGFGTLKAGALKFLTFAAALTLTHHASSLILPGAANITTSANACALAKSLGSGNWQVLFYQDGLGGGGSGDAWSDAVDADIVPDADGTRDLGATGTRFAETYTDALFVTNNITVGGTVDGRDLASDGSKLDGIETSADVTDEANVTAALDGATLTDVGTPASGDLILLQDASDSNNLKVAQFSTFGGAGSGDAWSDAVDADIVPDADGTRDLGATATRFAETYTDALFVTNNITVGGTVDGRDLASDGSKLDLIEANADVTDTANVTSAGAVMDSEVTNLALIKAVTTAADATWEAGVSTTAAIPTPANIAAAIAALESGGGGGSTAYGDVGTYAFMLDDNSNVSARAPGSTLAGSSLKPSAVLPDQSGTGQPDNQTAPSGTWRLMGGYSDDTADNDYILSLWLRIS